MVIDNSSIDELFIWKAPWSVTSVSRIRIYQTGNFELVIATEALENKGANLTYGAEYALHQAIVLYKLSSQRLLWIEHYPPGEVLIHDAYHLVHFCFNTQTRRFCNPCWKILSLSEVVPLCQGDPRVLGDILPRPCYFLRAEGF